MVREKPQNGSWRQFITAHMHETAACDVFLVQSLTFKPLFCFVVLSLDRRKILHVNVTRFPTAEWADQELLAAFKRTTASISIQLVTTGRRMPRMDAQCERVIGTIRHECTDHVIAFGEAHLSRLVRKYVPYYNEARPLAASRATASSPA